ncbi:hypothetical protein A3A70_02745 [candidate division WWE3 bacterium RIFCSPLOWO2_01_FULL_42_11]|uniref:YgjP-like metallopeptidase domain-containing protein n=1 Tax=candidate division WWE3 bacterium RIFCSPLOWO2_01_FULL_42_11 TaxID=1802627 RepID=A0A1F4VQ62_UNCKA|nr:MAG: hypothetical protein A3A70_02745 [candidate division WWE3 bacterium RIFCSPLOWO2_01_FULL_42_11]
MIFRIPHFSPPNLPQELFERNQEWITKQLAKISANYPKYKPHTFTRDEEFLMLGKPIKLTFTDGNPEFHKNKLAKWYKSQAMVHFTKGIAQRSIVMGLTIKGLKLSNARMKWGSCSRDGNIRLTWRLIMAPPEIIDYVIVHELAHITHHNHSQDFWSLVESFIPDYKVHRKWLKYNGHLLSLE